MAKILVVDDEKNICEEFREILEEENHQVDIALQGEEAIEKVRENDYDLVFLDVLMPRMEGREVFEAMRQIRPVRVVIMSGYMPPYKEREILALGAVACLTKPLSLDKVRKLLRSFEKDSPV